MEDTFIGGWTLPASRQPSPRPTPPDSQGNGSVQMNVPVPSPFLSQHLRQTGYPFVQPPPESVSPAAQGSRPDENLAALPSPVERSRNLNLRKATMQPYLQFMCGPLLRYDAVDGGVWHGAALIVSKWRSVFLVGLLAGANTPTSSGISGISFVAADGGSTYEPYPTLKYCWDPKQPATYHRQHGLQATQGVDLGPHPADPMALHFQANDGYLQGPDVLEERVLGTELYVYSGRGGCVSILHVSTPTLTCVHLGIVSTYTFWRFLIRIPLAESEMKIQYSINDGLKMDFFVPGLSQTMRLAAYSVSDLNRHRIAAS